ncbi:MAG: tetratricopeptide repeat protein [Brevinematales bacterium]|nr:tetratricopeptide repeat protein [Brevinematales bacterium]
MSNGIAKLLFFVIVLLTLVSVSYSNDENLYRVGIGAFKDELYMVSESQFKVIVEQYPNSRYFQDALYYLLLSQYFQKKYNDALKTISLIEGKYRYIKFFPKVVYVKGRILFDIGDYRSAIRTFENYLRNYPVDEDAPFSAYYMGLSYSLITNNQRAVEILIDAEKTYSNAPIIEDIKYRIAKIYFDDGNLDNAYVRFKDFERLFPNSKYISDVFYTIGKILFQKGNTTQVQTNLLYDASLYFSRSAEFQSYLRPYAMFNSGVSSMIIGQYQNSILSFTKLIDEFSVSSDPAIRDIVNEATYNVAKIYYTLGDIDNAVRYFRMSISQGGKYSTKSVIELSDLLYSQGKLEDSVSILSQYTNNFDVLLKYAVTLQTRDPETSEQILLSMVTNQTISSDVKNDAVVELLRLLIRRGKYDFIVLNFKLLLDNSSDEYTTSFVYFALGEAHLNAGNYKFAISSYSQVSDKTLKEDAIEGIAYSHFLSENYTLAIKFYNDLISNYNSDKYRDRANYLIGVSYERLKRNDEARRYYDILISTGKDKKYILSGVINLGWIYVRDKKFDDAISLVSNYIGTTTEIGIYEHLSEVLAWAYDGKGDYSKAVDTLRRLVLMKDIPDLQKVRYYNYISLFYEKSGNLKLALETVEKELLTLTQIRGLTNHTVEAIGRIIDLTIKLKDDNKTLRYISELKKNYTNVSKSYEYIYRYAEYLYSVEKYKEAGDEFVFIFRNSDDRVLVDEAYFWGGWAYFNAKRTDDALNIFNQFVNNSSSSRVPSVLLTLGDIMVNQRRFQEARNYYQRIVNQYRNSPEYNEAVIRLSRIASIQRDDKATSQQPSQPRQPSQQLQQQRQEKSIDEIISSLESISKSKDKDAASRAKFELAMIYKSQRDYQKAINLLQEITEQVYNETSAMAQFEIGEILRINGDYSRAWKEYVKVIYIYKDFKDIVVKAMYYTIFCYVQIKEYDQARKMYDKMVRDFYKNPWTEKAKELLDKI